MDTLNQPTINSKTEAALPSLGKADKAKIKDLPIGEYIRLKENGPAWIRQSYDKGSKRYNIVKADDMCHWSTKAGNAEVFIGFTY